MEETKDEVSIKLRIIYFTALIIYFTALIIYFAALTIPISLIHVC